MSCISPDSTCRLQAKFWFLPPWIARSVTFSIRGVNSKLSPHQRGIEIYDPQAPVHWLTGSTARLSPAGVPDRPVCLQRHQVSEQRARPDQVEGDADAHRAAGRQSAGGAHGGARADDRLLCSAHPGGGHWAAGPGGGDRPCRHGVPGRHEFLVGPAERFGGRAEGHRRHAQVPGRDHSSAPGCRPWRAARSAGVRRLQRHDRRQLPDPGAGHHPGRELDAGAPQDRGDRTGDIQRVPAAGERAAGRRLCRRLVPGQRLSGVCESGRRTPLAVRAELLLPRHRRSRWPEP